VPPATRSSSRIRSLDGLRGVAAFAVLLHHVSLVARPEIDKEAWAWITQSPLKLLFPGTESVLIFFVLSGLAVALPALRPGFSWVSYYPARMVRLYLPVLGALLLAALFIVLLPRDPSTMPDGSWMRNAQATTVTPGTLLSEASLTQRSYDIDNVLWSLRWEVIFSLLLPLFVWVALRVTRHPFVLGGLCIAATVLGRVLSVDVLVYIPLFLIGSIMATHIDELRALRLPRWAPPALALLAAGLLIASWLSRPLPLGRFGQDVLWGLAGAGAALIVVLAIAWPRFVRVLETRPAQWLGQLSFSLYLVHVPILATLVYLCGSSRWWLASLIAIPVSIVVAELFRRAVEAPSHKLARALGSKATGLPLLSGR